MGCNNFSGRVTIVWRDVGSSLVFCFRPRDGLDDGAKRDSLESREQDRGLSDSFYFSLATRLFLPVEQRERRCIMVAATCTREYFQRSCVII